MNVQGIYAVASQFKERHLRPLQFPSSKPAKTGAAASAGKNAGQAPKAGTDEHFDHVMARSGDLLARTDPHRGRMDALRNEAQRVHEDHTSDSYGWHAEHSSAATDLLHTFNSRMGEIQAQTKPSTSGGWAAYNDTFGPKPSAPSTPATPSSGLVHPSGRGIRSSPSVDWPSPAAPERTAPTVAPTPVKSEAQFSQPKQADYRQAASPAPRPMRTYHAPTPEPFTPAASPAPTRARSAWNPAWDNSTHWSANLPSRPASTPSPASQPKPRASRAQKKAAPAPAKPSDSEWHAMLSDSVTEHQATKAEPAPTLSSSPQFRETKLTVHGKEQVIRTEHNGTQAQLDAKHTKAVKAALGSAYAPHVQEAQQTLGHVQSLPNVKKSVVSERKSDLAKVKRKAAGYNHATPKPGSPRPYGTKEQLSMFEGDGPDDPMKSHEYGIKK